MGYTESKQNKMQISMSRKTTPESRDNLEAWTQLRDYNTCIRERQWGPSLRQWKWREENGSEKCI